MKHKKHPLQGQPGPALTGIAGYIAVLQPYAKNLVNDDRLAAMLAKKVLEGQHSLQFSEEFCNMLKTDLFNLCCYNNNMRIFDRPVIKIGSITARR